MDLRILVLGPVQVTQGERLLAVGGSRAQTVLAALVISLRHAVSDDHLIDALWGDAPPQEAVASLQSHISRLRRHLGADAIRRTDHSYLLDIDPANIDACQFERLLAKATEAAGEDPARARELCRQALDLWRGPPFGDLGEADFARPEAIRLEELRVDAVELYLASTIESDHPVMALPSLQAAVKDHPYREKLWYLLIKGLAHEGRRVEALRSFEEARQVLGEAGLEPTVDLRELSQQIYDEEDRIRPRLSSPA